MRCNKIWKKKKKKNQKSLPHSEVFEDEETSDQEEKESQNSTGRFPNELQQMMYGFSDKNSYAESVNVMEDLVVHFITEATKKCMDIGRKGKVSVHDL